MRRCKFFFAARHMWMLCALITLALLVGCGATGPDTATEAATPHATVAPTEALTDPATDAPTDTPTAAPTEPVTEAPTAPVTEAPVETEPVGWAPDTGTFNEGRVTYEKGSDGVVLATPADGVTLGLDITDKTDVVGICYSVWFDYILGQGDEPVTDYYNVTEALAGVKDWGPSPAFHYWAKPAQGYYRSSDKTAIRNNMTMLYAAGVDFIILDHTNLNNGYLSNADLYKRMINDPMVALFDTIMDMRAEGKGTPYVVVWCGDNDGLLYRDLYDNFYNVEKWRDCFVYWDGLPLLLTTHTRPENFPLKEENIYTVRSMWGLGCDIGGGQWSYLNPNIVGCITRDQEGNPEHMGLTTAAQRGYMATGVGTNINGSADAVSRKGGKTWFVQWYYAFKVRPKILTLTWWNEWTAQRLTIGPNQYAFTDNFNQEFSRDIEPMTGGHGDQYYRWMIEYISAYKGHLECPVLVEEGEEAKAVMMLRDVKKSLKELGLE